MIHNLHRLEAKMSEIKFEFLLISRTEFVLYSYFNESD